MEFGGGGLLVQIEVEVEVPTAALPIKRVSALIAVTLYAWAGPRGFSGGVAGSLLYSSP